MLTKKVNATELMKLKVSDIVGVKSSTTASTEAVKTIISLSGGIIPIPIVYNKATGHIVSGLELYRVLRTLSQQELKAIKEIPFIVIDEPDLQKEIDLVTTLPDVAPHWRVNDFVKLYAEQGNRHFKSVLKLCKTCSRVYGNLRNQPRSAIAIQALKPGVSSDTLLQQIKAGTFTTNSSEIRRAKRYAGEVLAAATALGLQTDGQFTSANIMSLLLELQRADNQNGHSNNDRIAEIQMSAKEIKEAYQNGWNRACLHSVFDYVEKKLPTP